MAISIRPIRKFLFVDTDSKIYEVILKQTDADSAAGVARQLGVSSTTPGTSVFNSDPSYNKTEVTFVVVSASVPAVMSPETTVAQLCVGAFYHATDEGESGAALATLLS